MSECWCGGQEDPWLKWKLRARRTLGWTATLVILGGVASCIYFLVIATQSSDQSSKQTFVQAYSVPMAMSFANAVVPHVFQSIIAFERYPLGRTEVRMAIIRVFVLRAVTIYTVAYSLKLLADRKSDCGGTLIGQTLYKLVIFDTVVDLCATLVLSFCGVEWRGSKIELNMPEGVLAMAYRQGMVWGGMAFSPVLPFTAALSLTACFYAYHYMTMRVCRPPSKRWKQGRFSTSFIALLLANLVLVAVPVLYFLQSYQATCGPYSAFSTPQELLSEWVSTGPGWLAQVLSVVLSPVAVAAVVCVLCCAVYWQGVRVAVWRRTAGVEEARGAREAVDKLYLTSLLRQAELARIQALQA
jgi:hypothetical protein